MAGRYRPRRQFRFLLYQDLAMEVTLTNYILKLKQSKQFVTTIKNALRLIGSLQERDLSVLYELFPWIGEAIRASAPMPPDTTGLEDRLAKRLEASVQQAIMNAPSLPATALVAAPIKQAAAAPIASIKAAQAADASTIADNFFASFQ